MKNYIKFSGLAVVCTVFVTSMSVFGISYAAVEPETLVDYLNDKNVSFLIVNSGQHAKLTTYGWQDAEKSCKTIKTAGYNVSNIRNFSTEGLVETNAVCKY